VAVAGFIILPSVLVVVIVVEVEVLVEVEEVAVDEAEEADEEVVEESELEEDAEVSWEAELGLELDCTEAVEDDAGRLPDPELTGRIVSEAIDIVPDLGAKVVVAVVCTEFSFLVLYFTRSADVIKADVGVVESILVVDDFSSDGDASEEVVSGWIFFEGGIAWESVE